MIDRLILVRHGETINNVRGITQGWTDSALSEKGESQVRRLAARLVSMQPASLYTSPLPRALATARAIEAVTAVAAVELEDLREMNCGSWEGTSFMELRESDPEFYSRWVDDPQLACPEGESFADVRERIDRALDVITAGAGTAIAVSHGFSIRIAATSLLQLPLAAARVLLQDNAAVNIFERRPERWLLRTWNDTTHCTAG